MLKTCANYALMPAKNVRKNAANTIMSIVKNVQRLAANALKNAAKWQHNFIIAYSKFIAIALLFNDRGNIA